MPVPSEPSVAASPTDPLMEPDPLADLPIELKVPLPVSRASSEDGNGGNSNVELESTMQSQGTQASVCEDYGDTMRGPIFTPKKEDHDSNTGEEVNCKRATSLAEFRKLVESERYQRIRCQSVRHFLEGLSFSLCLNRRLLSRLSMSYCTMIGRFRDHDQASFAILHQTCEKLVEDCSTSISAFQSRGVPAQYPEPDLQSQEDHSLSWIQRLPPPDQEAILRFLVKLRTDAGFLSTSISRLSSSELVMLASPYQHSLSSESVLQSYSNGKSKGPTKEVRRSNYPFGPAVIRGFQMEDPFFICFHSLFDSFSIPGSHEYSLRNRIWSSVCAQVITEGKRGSDEFIIATLNTFSSLREWKLKKKTEIFLKKLIQEGAFLLQPSQHTDFTHSVEIQNAQVAVAESLFFDKALQNFFQILADEPLRNGIPNDALQVAHEILRKIEDPRIRLRAKSFITYRWYFSSFIANVIVYPETQGIMMDHHISDKVRAVIFKEMANRLQKQVADVITPWNHMSIVTPETQTMVCFFLDLFEPPRSDQQTIQMTEVGSGQRLPLMFSPQDMACLINFVYPEFSNLPATTSHLDRESSSPTASSAGRSSTLIGGLLAQGTDATSSSVPSTSGTSATSDTLISEVSSILTAAKDSTSSTFTNPTLTDSKLQSEKAERFRLKEISRKMKFSIGFDKLAERGQSANEWAFIYISNDGTKLSPEPIKEELVARMPIFSHSNVFSSFSLNDAELESLKKAISSAVINQDISTRQLVMNKNVENPSANASILLGLFESAMFGCQTMYDFEQALFWSRNAQSLRKLLAQNESVDPVQSLLDELHRDLQSSIGVYNEITDRNLAQHRFLDTLHHSSLGDLYSLAAMRSALRVKIWYNTDIRHSGPFEDTSHVTRALRSMTNSVTTKQPRSISNWSRHRSRNSFNQDRSEKQVLELLCAHRDHGGLSKLADDQIELTTRWLTRNSIENFCRGEERIHRFCYEVQKCVNKLVGLNLMDNPVLWTSRLFEREKLAFDTRSTSYGTYSLTPKYPNPYAGSTRNEASMFSLPSSLAQSPEMFSHQFYCSTIQCNRASDIPNPANPIHQTGIADPSRQRSGLHQGVPDSVIMPQPLIPFTHTRLSSTVADQVLDVKKAFVHETKRLLQTIMISDLGYLLWAQGSETDSWVNLYCLEDALLDGKSQFLSRPTIDASDSSLTEVLEVNCKTEYPQKVPHQFDAMYKSLLDKFCCSADPGCKLQSLFELELLISNSITDSVNFQSSQAPTKSSDITSTSTQGRVAGRQGLPIPRTKATSLEEVMANCTERRTGTLKSSMLQVSLSNNPALDGPSSSLPTTDVLVSAFLKLFRDPALRPSTLFRDLQYVAAFVPSSTLDQTPQGKAFWDAGLAALSLKEDLCEAMITRANEITTYHMEARPAPSVMSPLPAKLHLASTTLSDAAHLWLTTAKEGSPQAARELGLFYLTHPELLPCTTLPFAKAKDVFFRPVIGSDHKHASGGGGLGGGNGGGAGASGARGLDPRTFAVAFHWMELAANGGDRDARDFLRGNGELSGAR